MTVLSLGQVATLMQQAGFPTSAIPQGLGVATAESGLRSDAVSKPNSNGTVDRGLWQINSVHGKDPARLMDPAYNTQVAFELWRSAGNSWRPWSTFNNGTAHVVNASNAVGFNPWWLVSPFGAGAAGVGGDIAKSTGLASLGQAAGVVIGTVTSVAFWKRAGALFAGFIILIVGFVILASGNKTVKTIAKTAAKGAVL